MKLYIKNMVSSRCVIVVKKYLDEIGIHYTNVSLGHVEINHTISGDQRIKLRAALLGAELELMEDKNIVLAEEVKKIIGEIISNTEDQINTDYVGYITNKLGYNYNYISNHFLEITGYSISQYILINRIEKVKEMLFLGNMSLSDIAWKLQYSSVAHLSSQFKKLTGYTPSQYKMLNGKKLVTLQNNGNTPYLPGSRRQRSNVA